jgi:hypothetical protein
VRRALPGTLALSDWNLVYSTRRDGISLNAFYRLTEGLSPTLMFVMDNEEHVRLPLFVLSPTQSPLIGAQIFGALAPDAWRRRSDKYYGTGDCFLFTFSPTFKVFQWTGANDCLQLSDEKFIGLGGGCVSLSVSFFLSVCCSSLCAAEPLGCGWIRTLCTARRGTRRPLTTTRCRV